MSFYVIGRDNFTLFSTQATPLSRLVALLQSLSLVCAD